MTDPKKNPNKQRKSCFWRRNTIPVPNIEKAASQPEPMLRDAQKWYRPTLLKGVVALGIVAVLPKSANGQFGIDTAAILAALSKMQSLMSTYIAAPLRTINQYELSTAKYEQEVIYPLTAINQAKTSVTQFENQFNQVSGLFRVNVASATHLEDEQIRVNVIPQKIKDGENVALTTPLSVTGTSEELDRDLPSTLVNFVGSHLGLKNTLDRVKEEMDAAAKAAQAEVRSKSKSVATKVPLKSEVAKPGETPKPTPPQSPEPARAAGLFDTPAPTRDPITDPDEEEEVLENEQFTPECDEEEAA